MDYLELSNVTLNKVQTSYKDLQLDKQPLEVQEAFISNTHEVPYVRRLISKDRPYAKDRPRDEQGRIVVDLQHPHILEDMDYFRQAALTYEKYGYYCPYSVNKNPNSEYYKFWATETYRCLYGMVRESDGEWIPGDYYFFLNYCPISRPKQDSRGVRVRQEAFSSVWDGQYLLFHYLDQCRKQGVHAGLLASRGKGKTFCGASLLAKRFMFGESYEADNHVECYVTASDSKYIWGSKQILNAFESYLSFCSKHTPFRCGWSRRNINTLLWKSGYINKRTKLDDGSQNTIMGISSAEDCSKLRGTRGALYLIEEAGSFRHLKDTYNVILSSVEQDNTAFGMIYFYGTAGDKDSDFSSMQEIMYHPKAYHVMELDNIYDLENKAPKKFTYFFPTYMNMEGCVDKDGNSDITKAILYTCLERYDVKNSTSDVSTVVKRVAEHPITPQEAILRTVGSRFPSNLCLERIATIDGNPAVWDDVLVGDLSLQSDGTVKYVPNDDIPIRDFPTKDNKVAGAIEFYKMPIKDVNNEVPYGRYIMGVDPVDSEQSSTMSLFSTFVLDLMTDNIVCEWTGRLPYADFNYERVRLIAMFYNASIMYENNLKGIYSYFAKMNSTYMLADTPQYLSDKEYVKSSGYGNTSKGIRATQAINNHADDLTVKWLMQPITVPSPTESDKEITVPKLNFVINRAFLRECVQYSPYGNFDRIRAIGILMMYREQKMIDFGGTYRDEEAISSIASDDYFTRNYEAKLRARNRLRW